MNIPNSCIYLLRIFLSTYNINIMSTLSVDQTLKSSMYQNKEEEIWLYVSCIIRTDRCVWFECLNAQFDAFINSVWMLVLIHLWQNTRIQNFRHNIVKFQNRNISGDFLECEIEKLIFWNNPNYQNRRNLIMIHIC